MYHPVLLMPWRVLSSDNVLHLDNALRTSMMGSWWDDWKKGTHRMMIIIYSFDLDFYKYCNWWVNNERTKEVEELSDEGKAKKPYNTMDRIRGRKSRPACGIEADSLADRVNILQNYFKKLLSALCSSTSSQQASRAELWGATHQQRALYTY